jgi:hypothetical protein
MNIYMTNNTHQLYSGCAISKLNYRTANFVGDVAGADAS